MIKNKQQVSMLDSLEYPSQRDMTLLVWMKTIPTRSILLVQSSM